MAGGEAAGEQSVIEIATLSTKPQFEQAVDVQREVWGVAEIDLLPVRLLWSPIRSAAGHSGRLTASG